MFVQPNPIVVALVRVHLGTDETQGVHLSTDETQGGTHSLFCQGQPINAVLLEHWGAHRSTDGTHAGGASQH